MKNKGATSFAICAFVIFIFILIMFFSGCVLEAGNELEDSVPVIEEIETIESASTDEVPVVSVEPTESIESPMSSTVPELTTPKPVAPVEPVGPTRKLVSEVEQVWQSEAEHLAKVTYGEAGCCSITEREKVIWCVLNRVDSPLFPNTIIEVITQYNQFHGYDPNHPVIEENYYLVLEAIADWLYEKEGGQIDRPLGPDYLFFCADGTGFGNFFYKTWGVYDG